MKNTKRLFLVIPLIAILCLGLILVIVFGGKDTQNNGQDGDTGGYDGENTNGESGSNGSSGGSSSGSSGDVSGDESNDSVNHEHTYGEWVLEAEPTCTEYGLEKRVCACGEKETRAIVSTGIHIYENGKCNTCGTKEPIPSEGLAFELNSDGESYSVVGIGTCSDTDVIIPGTYNDKPVTHIGVRAFEYCGKLTSIVIPDSVTGISSDAFANCANLTSITIGKGVKAVSGGVFGYCKKLKEIHISDIASWCNIEWSDNPFDYHYASELYLNGKLLTDLIIPNGVTSVAGAAFRSYDKLASVTIPDSVTSIGDQAFYSCDALASITIGSGVASIGNTAFGASKALKSITVSPSNPVYHSEENCLIQTETKTLILGCETSVIPADGSVTMIGSSAFCYESLLTSIVIPTGVTEVGEYAFSGCENLQSVTFPNTLKWIASKSFAQCPLVDIYFNGTKAEWDAVPKSSGYQREWDDGAYNYTVHCSDGDIVSDG